MSREARVQYVYSELLKRGLNPVAAAAVTGHLIEESGYFAPDVVAGQRRGDSGTAFGIAQWRGPRLTGLQKFAAARGKPISDINTQIDYIFHEGESGSDLGARRALAQLKNARTLDEATAAFAHFERPSGYSSRNPRNIDTFGKRLSHAQSVLSMFGKGASTPGYGAPPSFDVAPKGDDKIYGFSPNTVKGQNPSNPAYGVGYSDAYGKYNTGRGYTTFAGDPYLEGDPY